jgi:4-amino-4-deoxy-L-arabinose transferase-like glycosyltransferase
VAGALRLAQLEGVSPNPFYDAAVRSMTLSWHNFFFGWGRFSLQLPEALAGTLSIPLLYDAVRRVVGRPAGLAAAVALAVLPESVLTAQRHDRLGDDAAGHRRAVADGSGG